jgi:transmembrane 9 superfamily protein 2/4
MRFNHLAFATSLLLSTNVQSFYLPGVAPKDYAQDEIVPVNHNALTSSGMLSLHLIFSGPLPFDFYNPDFHFCRPEGTEPIQGISESLGSILFGDRLVPSSLQMQMNVNATCQEWCSTTVPIIDAKKINNRILKVYRFH